MPKSTNSKTNTRLIIGTVVVLALLASAGFLVARYAPDEPFAESDFLNDVGDANQYQ